MRATITFTYESASGLERVHELPAKRDVCDRCEGTGTHLHPAIGQHAYTPEEFRESFDDEEAEEYMTRGGRYDVPCEQCHGANVVLVVDEAELERSLRGRRLLAIWTQVEEERASMRYMEACERRNERRQLGEWD